MILYFLKEELIKGYTIPVYMTKIKGQLLIQKMKTDPNT